jgi:hypothetical protein
MNESILKERIKITDDKLTKRMKRQKREQEWMDDSSPWQKWQNCLRPQQAPAEVKELMA